MVRTGSLADLLTPARSPEPPGLASRRKARRHRHSWPEDLAGPAEGKIGDALAHGLRAFEIISKACPGARQLDEYSCERGRCNPCLIEAITGVLSALFGSAGHVGGTAARVVGSNKKKPRTVQRGFSGPSGDCGGLEECAPTTQ
jgi:hypothetical protein